MGRTRSSRKGKGHSRCCQFSVVTVWAAYISVRKRRNGQSAVIRGSGRIGDAADEWPPCRPREDEKCRFGVYLDTLR